MELRPPGNRAGALHLGRQQARPDQPAAVTSPKADLSGKRRLFAGVEDIRRDQDDRVLAVVAVPMHGRPRLSGRVAGLEGLRRPIVVDDGVGALNEIGII